jgi:beta,beta-carotene 9',10'-dioxygenase
MKKFFVLLIVVGIGWGACMGFKKVSAELKEELSHRPLKSSGRIPEWLSGSLIRNGPIYVTVDGKTNEHWLDGLAMLHAFSFHNGEVRYSNKFLRSDAYTQVFEKGSLDYKTFASDPCRSLFKRFLTFFLPKEGRELPNANVNVAKMADTYVALTETPLPISFDPQTLETLGVLDYQDQLPHGKCWESAHPHYDSVRKETFNYLIQYGRFSEYILYRLKEGSSEREVIARIKVDEPSYMHSFALTERYVVFTEFPFVVKPLDLITKNRAFIKNFSWHPERGTQFTVVERGSGHIVGRYKTKPFFAFHHANAFEKDGRVYVDMVCYDDPSIITDITAHFKPDIQGNKDKAPSRLERFILTLQSQELTSEMLFNESIEFPRINGAFDGSPYRSVYLIDAREPEERCLRSLYKVNVETKEFRQWQEVGCSPGEPVFVSKPGGVEEDEGVVLAVVWDMNKQNSFLLVLDGQSFEEMGRAEVTHVIPTGLHGQYFPDTLSFKK